MLLGNFIERTQNLPKWVSIIDMVSGVYDLYFVDHKLLLLALCMKLNHHFIIQIEFSMNHDCNNLVEQTSAFRPLIYDCRESSHWSMTLLERAVSPSSQLNYLYTYMG